MKFVRLLIALALVLGLSLGVVGCQSDENVAARVNGDEISLTELNQQVDQLKEQYPNMFDGSEGEGRLLDFKQRLLDNLINQKLIEQAAEDKGIEISDEDIQKQIATLKKGFQGDEAKFQQALKSAGLDEAGLEQQVREQLMQQKLIAKLSTESSVTADDIKAYYEANKSQFEQKAAKRASHILFKPEDEATAKKVLAEVQAGGDFAAAAKKYSQDPGSAANGGDLGWPTTGYVKEFQAALDALKVGAMTTTLVKSQYGWHIIKATDERAASTKTLEEAKTQIEQIITQQRKAEAYQKFLKELRDKAEIEILIEELKASSSGSKSSGSKTTTSTGK